MTPDRIFVTGRQKYVGCILGGAIGDAIGRPMEFRPRWITLSDLLYDGSVSEHSVTTTTDPLSALPPCSYTDDTFLNLHQVIEFTERLPVEEDPPEEAVRRALRAWWEDCERRKREVREQCGLSTDDEVETYATRCAGPTTVNVAKTYSVFGIDEEAAKDSESCGPLTRVVTFMLARAFPDDSASAGQFYARQSHKGAATVVATATVACLVRFCFDRTSFTFADLDTTIRQVLSDLRENHAIRPRAEVPSDRRQIARALDELERRYGLLRTALLHGRFDAALTAGVSSHAFDVLLTSVAILAITKGDFADTVELVKKVPGDSDSIGSLCCSLCGLLKGARKIEKRFLKLDHNMQWGAKEIEKLASQFYQRVRACPSKGIGVRMQLTDVGPKALAEDTVKRLKRAPDGFISHGALLGEGSVSTLTLLRELRRDDRVFLSESGVAHISDRLLASHPVCVAHFIARCKGSANPVDQRKMGKLIAACKTALLRTRDSNERLRLANLLEFVGSRESASILAQCGDLGQTKSVAVRAGAVLDEVLRIVRRLRNPADVPEKAFHNAALIVTTDGITSFLQRNTFLRTAAGVSCRRFDELEKCARLGGCYLISTNGYVRGPLFVRDEVLVEPARWPEASLPVPLREQYVQRLRSQGMVTSILIYPRRNAVFVVRNRTVASASREAGEPKSLRDECLDGSERECRRTWDTIAKITRSMPPAVVCNAIALAEDVVMNGDHGCTILIKRRSGSQGTPRGSRLGLRIKLTRVRSRQHVDAASNLLVEDGAVLVDSSSSEIIAFGQWLHPDQNGSGRDVEERIVRRLEAERRGSRHLVAATVAAGSGGSCIVVVGSGRGDLTVFGHTECVPLLRAGEE